MRKRWPLAAKIAVGFLVALAVAIVAAIAVGEERGSYEKRRAYRDELRPLFDWPNDVQIEGHDGKALLFNDRECTLNRSRRYAFERAVYMAGFEFVCCHTIEAASCVEVK